MKFSSETILQQGWFYANNGMLGYFGHLFVDSARGLSDLGHDELRVFSEQFPNMDKLKYDSPYFPETSTSLGKRGFVFSEWKRAVRVVNELGPNFAHFYIHDLTLCQEINQEHKRVHNKSLDKTEKEHLNELLFLLATELLLYGCNPDELFKLYV